MTDVPPPRPDPAAEEPLATAEVELTVVMPCLNEADTLATCIEKALAGIEATGAVGEIVVADNGSTDGSPEIARGLGARVVPVARPGYGSALMGGIDAARGRFVIMGDADDSYDFGEIPNLVAKLREGNDLVQGCRLPAGGGTVAPGAMPFLHRWLGNPMFTLMVRVMFGAPINDVYCGLRGFSKALYDRLDMRCTGMEFATEMIIKASSWKDEVRIAEVPITLHQDGRKAHAPHLKTFRDGWRTLRFFLMLSPSWLFLYPGMLLAALGAALGMVALAGMRIGGVEIGPHSLLVGGLAILMGYQSVLFSVMAKTFATEEGLIREDPGFTRLFDYVKLEVGLIGGVVMLIGGLGLIGKVAWQWQAAGYPDLHYPDTLPWVIPGTVLAALGFETFLFSFFISILGMRRR